MTADEWAEKWSKEREIVVKLRQELSRVKTELSLATKRPVGIMGEFKEKTGIWFHELPKGDRRSFVASLLYTRSYYRRFGSTAWKDTFKSMESQLTADSRETKKFEEFRAHYRKLVGFEYPNDSVGNLWPQYCFPIPIPY